MVNRVIELQEGEELEVVCHVNVEGEIKREKAVVKFEDSETVNVNVSPYFNIAENWNEKTNSDKSRR